MFFTHLVGPTIKLKSQRPTNGTGNKLLPKESSYTLQTVALKGWMLTNQRTKAHLVEEVSHASQITESEIPFYSSRCIASFGVKCVFNISGRTHE